MDEASLVALAQRFADARGVSLYRVGYLAVDDGQFFIRLQRGHTCTLRVAREAVLYIGENWPADDRGWLADIPRPVILDEASLVALAQRFADARGVSLYRVGYLAVDDGQFFIRLQRGHTCTLRVAREAVLYISENWPADDGEWPADIPRPAIPSTASTRRRPHRRRTRRHKLPEPDKQSTHRTETGSP